MCFEAYGLAKCSVSAVGYTCRWSRGVFFKGYPTKSTPALLCQYGPVPREFPDNQKIMSST